MLFSPAWGVAANAGTTGQGDLVAVAMPPALGTQPSAISPTVPGEVLLLAVRVNGVDRDDPIRVLRNGGTVSLNAADWAALHLRAATGQTRHVEGQDYFALDMAGLHWRIDEDSQTLVIEAPANAFLGATLRMDESPTTQVMAPAKGAYANYDVEVDRAVAGGNRPGTASAMVEVGVFGFGGGTIASSGLLLDSGAGLKPVRLETTWTHDSPGRMASLRVGDGTSRAGAWGNAMRFAGLQWATDFSLQPGFVSFPLPSVRGESSLPSTVDVFINNSRQLQSNVPAGPFDLTNLPIVTGSGEVRLVVQDALGRQQVITQPYYVSPSLLKPGLHAYSYEIGAVRDDYGLSSDHYGSVIASATDRAGVSEHFTRELRAEAQDDHVTAGATGIWLVPGIGVATLGVVGSVAHGEGGGSVLASLERQGKDWNGTVQVRRSTADYVQAGQSAASARMLVSAALGGSVGNIPMGLSYIQQQPFEGAATRLLSANLSHTIGRIGTIGLYALRDLTSRTTTASLSLSVALDARTSAALSSTRSSSADERGSNQLQLQRNLPDGNGLGYQLSAANGQSDQITGQVFARTGVADLNAGVARANQETDMRAGASGALVWMDGTAFATRRADGSFAVVEVGDYADVAVTRDHHEVARTDEHGRAFVSGLRGYEVNRVGAEPSDLPFDASVDALDVQFVPPARAGVILRMPIQRSRSASFRVVDADGKPLPAGTLLSVAGRDTTYPVGFDGKSFIAGLAGGDTVVRAQGGGTACHFLIAFPSGDADDLPDLGTQRCQ